MADPSSHIPPTHQRSMSSASTPNPFDQMAQRIIALETQLAAQQAATVQSNLNINNISREKKPTIPNPKQFSGEIIGNYTIDEWIDDVEKQVRHSISHFTSESSVMEWV